MLELKTGRSWGWFAEGKHPAVKDFISIGSRSPMGGGLAAWMDSGWSQTSHAERNTAWRFFARGAGKEELICGLIRSSCDSIGRPYPFLIVGSGTMAGWADNWDLVPLACEHSWQLMEGLAGNMAGSVACLEKELLALTPPVGAWDLFRSDEAQEEGGGPVEHDQEVDWLPLECDGANEICHRVGPLRRKGQQLPSAVFAGGANESTFCVIFGRPLRVSDFVNLWSK